MEVGSTGRHARDKFYQAPSLFSCNIEKIGEPGDEANLTLAYLSIAVMIVG